MTATFDITHAPDTKPDVPTSKPLIVKIARITTEQSNLVAEVAKTVSTFGEYESAIKQGEDSMHATPNHYCTVTVADASEAAALYQGVKQAEGRACGIEFYKDSEVKQTLERFSRPIYKVSLDSKNGELFLKSTIRGLTADQLAKVQQTRQIIFPNIIAKTVPDILEGKHVFMMCLPDADHTMKFKNALEINPGGKVEERMQFQNPNVIVQEIQSVNQQRLNQLGRQ